VTADHPVAGEADGERGEKRPLARTRERNGEHDLAGDE